MHKACLAALVGLAALTGCDRPPRPIDPAMEPKLQALATSACHCEQVATTKAATAACWKAYGKAGKASVSGRYTTSCAPVSDSGHVYNADTPQEFMINTGSDSPVGKLCTGEEVKAVETAWQRAFEAKLTGEAMNAQMRQALKDLKEGRQVAMTGGGCSG